MLDVAIKTRYGENYGDYYGEKCHKFGEKWFWFGENYGENYKINEG